MRTFDDLIKVRVTGYFIADLDWERIEADPHWEMVAVGFDLSDATQKQQALERYLTQYILREQLLTMVPSTNGPSDFYITNMESVAHGHYRPEPERGHCTDSEPAVHREDSSGL